MSLDYRLGIRPVGPNHTALSKMAHAESFADAPQPSSSPTIAHRFQSICNTYAERTCLEDHRGARDYQWLHCQASLIANHLTEQATFTTGSRVGIQLTNSPEYIAAFYGIQLAGGVAVPIPPYYRKHKLDPLLEMTQTRFLFEPAETAQPYSTKKHHVIELNATQVHPQFNRIAPKKQLAMLLFTSGSSGQPKAVMLSHQNVLTNMRSILQSLPMASGDRSLANMPFAHALGNSVLQTHVLNGACLVFPRELLFPVALLSALKTNRCTSLIAVPDVFELLLKGTKPTALNIPTLRFMAVAGGPMSSGRIQDLANRIAPADFFVMYGQTEATARLACSLCDPTADQGDTIGKPIPGVEFSIRNEQGVELNTGRVGTLHARGNNVMMGYWNDPTGTEAVINEGWLDTGDRAVKNEAQNFRIVGRANGLVKISGYRFHPNEVDSLLERLAPGQQFTTVAYQKFNQTKLATFVIAESLTETESDRLRLLCADNLPKHMIPHQVIPLRNWPLNSANKIDPITLSQWAAQKHNPLGFHRSA